MRKDNWYKFVDKTDDTFEYFKFDSPLSDKELEAFQKRIKMEMKEGYSLFDAVNYAADALFPNRSFMWGSPFQCVVEI